MDSGETTASRTLLLRMHGLATPAWYGSSTRCADGLPHRRSRTRHISHSQSSNELWGTACFLCTQNVDNLHEHAGSKNIVHMHGELFKNRCDSCSRPPFEDTNLYEPPTDLPRCECGGGIRPHICWFGETPFGLDKVFRELDQCMVFIAIGTSGVVEPAASFVEHVHGRAQTVYVGPEEPANATGFAERHLGRAGELLPNLLDMLQ